MTDESLNKPQAKPQDDQVMPKLDEHWASLARDWQSQSFPKTNMERLLRSTRRRLFWGKLCLVSDIVVSFVLIVATCYAVFYSDWPAPTVNYLFFGALLSALFSIITLKSRLESWQQLGAGPDKVIANAIVTTRSSIKYLKWVLFFMPLILGAVCWFAIAMAELKQKSYWPGLLWSCLLVLGIGAIAVFKLLRAKRELKQLDRISSE